MYHLKSSVAIVIVAGACAVSSCALSERDASCLADTPAGYIEGRSLAAVCAYLGIPYAAPPVGELRWKPPQPARPWTPATRQAATEPPLCAQVSPEGSSTIIGSEDCLTLSIWTPNPRRASPSPVIVWIHGGGFTSTSERISEREAQRLIQKTGAVLVSINYRVGPFGFLAHSELAHETPASTGNYGLLDQRAALEWVKGHITAFGGNPRDVTLAGQSAGAHSVSLHVVSPRSAGYFARAIMQNGWASTRWRTLADAETLGRELAAALGCAEPSTLACLRSKSTEQVLLALPTGLEQFAETARAPWGPVVDGIDIPDQPRAMYESGRFNHVPIVVLTVRDEGSVLVNRSFPSDLTPAVYEAEIEAEFGTGEAPTIRARYPLAAFRSPKDALARITADVENVCEARRIAALVARAGIPVAAYSLDRRTLFDFIGDGWHQLHEGDYLAIRNHPDSSASPCDLWDPLFLASVAGSVPASMP